MTLFAIEGDTSSRVNVADILNYYRVGASILYQYIGEITIDGLFNNFGMGKYISAKNGLFISFNVEKFIKPQTVLIVLVATDKNATDISIHVRLKEFERFSLRVKENGKYDVLRIYSQASASGNGILTISDITVR